MQVLVVLVPANCVATPPQLVSGDAVVATRELVASRNSLLSALMRQLLGCRDRSRHDLLEEIVSFPDHTSGTRCVAAR